MTRNRLVLASLAMVLSSAGVARGGAPATGPESPASVVKACYAHHFAHGMAFTEASVREKSKWLATDTLDACLAYLAAPANPDEVPAIDGDPFTDSQEYPRAFRVGRAVVTEWTARVPVTLLWRHEQRTVHVVLTLEDAAWRIRNVEYEDGSSLAKLLAEGS